MNDPLPVFVKPTADEDVPEHVRHAPKDSSNGASDLTHDDMMHAASATHMLTKPMWDMKPFSAMLAVVGIILVVFFALFVDYADTPDDADNYQLFIHVCIMIFVGFGFLMTFLKRYSLAAVCLNYITVRASRAALHALAYQSSAHFVLTQGKVSHPLSLTAPARSLCLSSWRPSSFLEPSSTQTLAQTCASSNWTSSSS
mmetsp:Transcript_7531/g.22027  ORF Transcript_7531/g.22027 Transcript_7531/m.22027 type:complete len:199 (+) Transcript_7531:47-643(+)